MAVARAKASDPPVMTVEECLEWRGGKSGVVYELVEGLIRAQDTASDAHGTVQGDLATEIGLHLRRHRPGCRLVVNSGVRTRLRATGCRSWRSPARPIGRTCTRCRTRSSSSRCSRLPMCAIRGATWQPAEATAILAGEALSLASIDLTLPLVKIYRGTHLAE